MLSELVSNEILQSGEYVLSKKEIGIIICSIAVSINVAAYIMKKRNEKNIYRIADTSVGGQIKTLPERKMGFYEKHVKRYLDVICAVGAIVCFFPLYAGVAVLVKIKLGSPILFAQDRPGRVVDGRETVFKMYKFRTMTEERDPVSQELLPDSVRLTRFGAWLRSTSLDELPEAFNILNGTMSVVGPRPQLVRDMVFMTDEQRMRHTAKPGLSGLAQINGRNDIDWEVKLDWDLKYIKRVGFLEDVKIILATIGKAFIKKEGITGGNMATVEDFGDYLLRKEKVSEVEYQEKKNMARKIVESRS
jgi:Sugar transferases involved in lipopolysaccharide synthesis